MAALHDTYRCSHKGCDSADYHRIRPVANNYLSLDPHSADNMTIFPVTVGRLVFVHKVHINAVIGNFFIELGMEMQQGLTILLQTQDPGFCR